MANRGIVSSEKYQILIDSGDVFFLLGSLLIPFLLGICISSREFWIKYLNI